MFEPKLENVMSVYNGVNGACACGCAGKHTYASAHREAAGIDRGYPVRDDEVNDRIVKLHFNKVFGGKNGEALCNDEKGVDHSIYYVESGKNNGRTHVVYFKDVK